MPRARPAAIPRRAVPATTRPRGLRPGHAISAFLYGALHGISGPLGKGPFVTDGRRAPGRFLLLPERSNGVSSSSMPQAEQARNPFSRAVRFGKTISSPQPGQGRFGGEGGDEPVENTLGKIQELPDLVYALIRLPIEAVCFLVKGVLVRGVRWTWEFSCNLIS